MLHLIQLFDNCCVKKLASTALVKSSCSSLCPKGIERTQVLNFKDLLSDPDLVNITTRHCFKTEVSEMFTNWL